MESKLKSYKGAHTLPEKTNLNITTPFSINDILTKENEAKCAYENFANSGFKVNFGKPAFKGDGYQRSEVLDKSMKYYDDCSSYRDFGDDAALDMSRKNNFPVTELSGAFPFS